MAKRQTRPLTPAEAVRQGRKLIAERRRQVLAAAQPEPISEPICQPDTAGQGGVGPAIGMPISEQDQRVEMVTGEVAQNRKLTRNACLAAAPTVEPRVIPDPAFRDKSAPQSAITGFVLAVPESASHPDGEWPPLALGPRQCRFACTADDVPRDQHRFFGRPTRISRSNLHGSWCDEHLSRVWGQGSVSERNAHHVTKDVRRFG